jgi:hypothetical protein
MPSNYSMVNKNIQTTVSLAFKRFFANLDKNSLTANAKAELASIEATINIKRISAPQAAFIVAKLFELNKPLRNDHNREVVSQFSELVFPAAKASPRANHCR